MQLWYTKPTRKRLEFRNSSSRFSWSQSTETFSIHSRTSARSLPRNNEIWPLVGLNWTTLSLRRYVDLWFYLNGKEMLDTLLQQFLWICNLYDWKQTFTSQTRSSVSPGGSGGENGRLSTLLHFTHLRKMFLAVCLPCMIQKRSLNAVNVPFTPLCNNAVVSFADYQIYGLMLPRRQLGSLAFLVKRAFLKSIRPLHRTIPLSSW